MKYFKTDGIRGIPNKKITVKLITNLGMALKIFNNKNVVIATDTRISKDMISYGIASGCMSRGINVHYAGIMPTPALVYYSYIKGYIGVMVTASHNPYYDNGIKIVNKGYKLSNEEELLLEEYIESPKEYEGEIGVFINELEAIDEYYKFINKYICKSNLKIAIDLANGATTSTAYNIFKRITNDLTVIGNEPNGININMGCGSTNIDNLKNIVILNKCDIGFAFDGDGDRLIVVSNKGSIIEGDMIVFILSMYLKKNEMLTNNKVVLSKMANIGIINEFKKLGIEVIETNVGDKFIYKEMISKDIKIGGENSGHIIIKDIFHTGDGVLNAILLLNFLKDINMSLEEIISNIKLYNYKIFNINNSRVKTMDGLDFIIEEIKRDLNYDCKIIVRASGTEDVIRIMVMALKEEEVLKSINKIIKFIEGE